MLSASVNRPKYSQQYWWLVMTLQIAVVVLGWQANAMAVCDLLGATSDGKSDFFRILDQSQQICLARKQLYRQSVSGGFLGSRNYTIYCCDTANEPLPGDTVIRKKLPPLPVADLSGTSLRGAVLGGTNLQDTLLNDADLSQADVSESNLSGANLSRADLSGANLRGANLTDAIVDDATWDNTICPDGSNSNDNGGTCDRHLGLNIQLRRK